MSPAPAPLRGSGALFQIFFRRLSQLIFSCCPNTFSFLHPVGPGLMAELRQITPDEEVLLTVWLVSANGWLRGDTPLEHLGEREAVLDAARKVLTMDHFWGISRAMGRISAACPRVILERRTTGLGCAEGWLSEEVSPWLVADGNVSREGSPWAGDPSRCSSHWRRCD